jgi:hypothetical protein
MVLTGNLADTTSVNLPYTGVVVGLMITASKKYLEMTVLVSDLMYLIKATGLSKHPSVVPLRAEYTIFLDLVCPPTMNWKTDVSAVSKDDPEVSHSFVPDSDEPPITYGVVNEQVTDTTPMMKISFDKSCIFNNKKNY